MTYHPRKIEEINSSVPYHFIMIGHKKKYIGTGILMRFTKEYLDRLTKISREAIAELSNPASSSQGRAKLKAILSYVPGGIIQSDGIIYEYCPKRTCLTSAFGDDLLIYPVNSLGTSASPL